jgi:hypothetical protein
LQLGVDRRGLLEVLVDPGRRLAKEEAPVSPRRTRTDPSALDERDPLTELGGIASDREAGEPAADDDSFPGQLGL